MKIINKVVVFTIPFLIFGAMVVFAGQGQPRLGASNDSFKKVLAKGKIIQQGHKYLRALQFDDALGKYEEALNADLMTSDDDYYHPLSLVIRVLTYQGQYGKALMRNQWYFQQTLFENVNVEAMKTEKPVKKKTVVDTRVDFEIRLRALLEWETTGDDRKLYEYINYMRGKHLNWLPPKKLGPSSNSIFTDITEIYDLLNSYDEGIAWAESFRKKAKSKRRKPEYENVIKAFEESKQGMPKICGDGGRTCVGRATAYIIQSDRI